MLQYKFGVFGKFFAKLIAAEVRYPENAQAVGGKIAAENS
jgi:hypothetical protein